MIREKTCALPKLSSELFARMSLSARIALPSLRHDSSSLSPRGGWYRPPPLTQRPSTHHPPAIPVLAQAWGYDINDDNSLSFARPAEVPGDPCGPGSYDPVYEVHMRRARRATMSGPERSILALTPPAPMGGESHVWGEPEEESVARKPMPSAVPAITRHSPRHSRQQRPRRPEFDEDTSPGPGAFQVASGVGRSQPVQRFPRQAHHHVRSVALPLPPLARGARREVQPHESLTACHAAISPRSPARPRRFMKTEKYDYFASLDDGSSSTGMPRSSAPLPRLVSDEAALMLGAWTDRDEPSGLDEETRMLWRSFCSIDVNGDGLVRAPAKHRIPTHFYQG
jgi:hypothetical protein